MSLWELISKYWEKASLGAVLTAALVLFFKRKIVTGEEHAEVRKERDEWKIKAEYFENLALKFADSSDKYLQIAERIQIKYRDLKAECEHLRKIHADQRGAQR